MDEYLWTFLFRLIHLNYWSK